MKSWSRHLVIVSAFVHSAVGQPVNDPGRIDVYVTPYYNSEGPDVHVG